MKRLITVLIFLSAYSIVKVDGYNDHRGYNIDSLERVAATWTPQMIENASDEQLHEYDLTWRALMDGYLNINSKKSEYYARKILSALKGKEWNLSEFYPNKIIGQCFWASDQYDSATFYYKKALDLVKNMSSGEVNPITGKEYTKADIDDSKSSLYGAIGNLFSIQGMIDSAMVYYNAAGEIFKKHGWLNSCSVLYYNMGETWLEERDLSQAESCYYEALDYAKQANDSLWIATSLKGLGGLFLEKGKTTKALKALKEADNYFSIHEDEELIDRLETVDFIGQVLSQQKKNLSITFVALAFMFILSGAVVVIAKMLHKANVEKEEVAVFIEETIAEAPKLPEIKLNDREFAILRMLSEGKETAEMADTLCLSPETIKWYRKRLLAKFDVTSAAALVAEAIKRGVIH